MVKASEAAAVKHAHQADLAGQVRRHEDHGRKHQRTPAAPGMLSNAEDHASDQQFLEHRDQKHLGDLLEEREVNRSPFSGRHEAR